VLAQSYFTNGFEVKYKAGEKEFKMILVGMEALADTQGAFTRYRQFVATSGKEVGDIKAPGEGGFAGKDSFYGEMAAVRSGSRIVIVLGVPSREAGTKAISELLLNIK
jgi:hypothetical protein